MGLTIKDKTVELIDAMKATCQSYGMGNDGNGNQSKYTCS